MRGGGCSKGYASSGDAAHCVGRRIGRRLIIDDDDVQSAHPIGSPQDTSAAAPTPPIDATPLFVIATQPSFDVAICSFSSFRPSFVDPSSNTPVESSRTKSIVRNLGNHVFRLLRICIRRRWCTTWCQGYWSRAH